MSKKFNFKKRNLALIAGISSLLALAALVIVLVTGGSGEASAKDKDKDKDKDGKQLAKSLTIVSVDRPQSFKAMHPGLTIAAPGNELVAVTIDFDRDAKNHIRSSESGEVYLTDQNGKTYYTVGTAVPQSDGPGKKPVRQATFVFEVPQGAPGLTFHYGAPYTMALPAK